MKGRGTEGWTAEDLRVRTKRFTTAVLEFAETLPGTPISDAIVRQLTRSGIGVARNYRITCRARSHVEFTARLGVVLEEADESRELLAIFSKAFATATNNDRGRHAPSRQR